MMGERKTVGLWRCPWRGANWTVSQVQRRQALVKFRLRRAPRPLLAEAALSRPTHCVFFHSHFFFSFPAESDLKLATSSHLPIWIHNIDREHSLIYLSCRHPPAPSTSQVRDLALVLRSEATAAPQSEPHLSLVHLTCKLFEQRTMARLHQAISPRGRHGLNRREVAHPAHRIRRMGLVRGGLGLLQLA